jgi:hypothetical protein
VAWIRAQNAPLTSSTVTFRIGGNGSAGISALLTVRGPSPMAGASLVATLDIGISVTEPISLAALTALLRDGLVLLADEVMPALDAIMPAEAEPTRYELILNIEASDLNGAMRPNDLARRIDVSACGTSTRQVIGFLGLSFEPTQGITTETAHVLVVDALNRMLLDVGYADADTALANTFRSSAPEG